MQCAAFRRLVAAHCLWWSACGILLGALQPFIATHFCQDGWEDEPAFRIRSVSASAQFEPDDRPEYPTWIETTIFVPSAASIDLPHTLQQGLDGLLALVFLALPLTIALARLPCCLLWRLVPQRVPHASGAPPPTALWLTQPPPTAPPLSN
jgi:hypothetical protein